MIPKKPRSHYTFAILFSCNAMADGDEGNDDFAFPFRRQRGDANNQKQSSQWSESCYGIWLNSKSGDASKKEQVCLGINFVHITKVR